MARREKIRRQNHIHGSQKALVRIVGGMLQSSGTEEKRHKKVFVSMCRMEGIMRKLVRYLGDRKSVV